MWWITPEDVEAIAVGAGILGTGGGGNPYLGKLRVLEQLKGGARIGVMPLEEVADDTAVLSLGMMGAPTVSIEKIAQGCETYHALRAMERYVGRPVGALIAAEIGGANSMAPLIVAAQSGLPVLDGDGMGRAFPELQMDTFVIYGRRWDPATLCDAAGQTVILDNIADPYALERLGRAVTIAMGGSAALAVPLMSGAEVREWAIPGTMSLAHRVGRAVLDAQARHSPPAPEILAVTGGRVLFEGKIVDVQRRTTQGFARGWMQLEGFEGSAGEQLRIDFQNENLIAWRDGVPIASVPDLICLIDHASGYPVTTEILRYGLRVTVLGIPAAPKLKTPEALAFVGPQAFGYDVAYSPL